MTPLPKLIVITDWELPRDELLRRVGAALSAGPEVAVQHRHRSASVRTLLEEGKAIADLCERLGNPLFINGHLELALLLNAHLHLPSDGYSAKEARPHFPAERWISVAVHNLEEAKRSAGADLALISPVFRPSSKPADQRDPLGAEGFIKLASSAPCPAFALGGIHLGNVQAVAGATGFAVISAVLRAKDSRAAACELLERTSDLQSISQGY